MKKALLIFLFASSLVAQVQLGKNVQIGGSGTGTSLKMKVVGPVSGQYVILYPGGHSSLPPLSGFGTLAADNNSAAFSQNPSVSQCCAEVDWNGFALPTYVNPANVTAVYAATIASYGNTFFNTNNPSVNSSCSNSITPFFLYNTSGSFSQKQFSTLMTSTPGSLISSVTCSTQIAGAGTVNGGVGAVDVAAIALVVYYTGPPPPLDTAISIITPLQYITATNSLGIDISYPFPGLNLLATTVAGLPQAQISPNSLYLIRDGNSSSDCTAGGGTIKVQCFSNGTSWSAFAGGGGGGTVTSFAAPSGSWPTWLVPTVTNSTTTPSLAVAASAIPNSALANASTTVNGTTCTLGSTCTISAGGAVSSVANSDGTLTVTPTTGAVVASLNLAHANTWTAPISVAVAGGVGGTFNATEGTAATAVAGHDILYADSTAHCLEYSANGGSFACLGSGSGGFPITLGSTSITSGSTTTAVAGLSVNSVTLNAAGSSSLFLNQAGGYTTPGGGFPSGASQLAVNSNANTSTTTPNVTYDQSNQALNVGLQTSVPKGPLILASFGGPAGQGATSNVTGALFVSVSTDGTNWQIINTGFTGLANEGGRDWSITKVGQIYYVAYSPCPPAGCSNDGVHIATGFGMGFSYDLVHWTAMSHVVISGTNPMVGYTYAPEFYLENPGCTGATGTDNQGYTCTAAQAVHIFYADSTSTQFNHNIYEVKALNAALTSWGNNAGTSNSADLVFSGVGISADAYDGYVIRASATEWDLFHVNGPHSCTATGAASCNVQYASSTTLTGTYTSVTSGDWTGNMGAGAGTVFTEAPSVYAAGTDASGNTIWKFVYETYLTTGGTGPGLVYSQATAAPGTAFSAMTWNGVGTSGTHFQQLLNPPTGVAAAGGATGIYHHGTVVRLLDMDSMRDIVTALATQSRTWGASVGGSYSNLTSSATWTGCTVSGGHCVVSSPVSSITISSISGGFLNLELSMFGTNSTASTADIAMQFNSDSTSGHYDYNLIFAVSGTGPSQSPGIGGALMKTCALGPTGSFTGGGKVTITEYANTSFNKTVNGLCGASTTSNDLVVSYHGNWHSTAAVTSITLTISGGGNFSANDAFSLAATN